VNILLLNGLPEDYEGIPISADFRNMIQVDLAMRDTELSDTEKLFAALTLLYPDIPGDTDAAVKGLAWFFTRDGAEDNGDKGKKQEKRSFDFEQDAERLYAAFYSTYGISLTTVDFLHWWEFMALFEGLPDDTLMKRVMYWRMADVSKMSKEEKKHVLQMRKLFELKQPGKKLMSLEEVNQQTLDRVAARFAAAEKAVQQKHDTSPQGDF